MSSKARVIVMFMLLAGLSACGGDGSDNNSTTVVTPGSTSPPTSTPATTSVILATTGATAAVAASGYEVQLSFPGNNAAANTRLSISASSSAPSGGTAVSSIGTAALLYLTVSSSANVTLTGVPSLMATLASTLSRNGGSLSVAYFDPATQSWTDFGNATLQGSALMFTGYSEPLTWIAGASYAFVLYQTGISGEANGTLVVSKIPSIDDTLSVHETDMPAIRAFNLSTKNCVTAGADSSGAPLLTCTLTDVPAPVADAVEFSGGTWSSGSGFPPVFDACYEASQNIPAAGFTVDAAEGTGCSSYAAVPDDGGFPPDTLCITVGAADIESEDGHKTACGAVAAAQYNNGEVSVWVCNHAGATPPPSNACLANMMTSVIVTLSETGYTGAITVMDNAAAQAAYPTLAAPTCENGQTFENPITVTPRTSTAAYVFTANAAALSANYLSVGNQCSIVFADVTGNFVVLNIYMW